MHCCEVFLAVLFNNTYVSVNQIFTQFHAATWPLVLMALNVNVFPHIFAPEKQNSYSLANGRVNCYFFCEVIAIPSSWLFSEIKKKKYKRVWLMKASYKFSKYILLFFSCSSRSSIHHLTLDLVTRIILTPHSPTWPHALLGGVCFPPGHH